MMRKAKDHQTEGSTFMGLYKTEKMLLKKTFHANKARLPCKLKQMSPKQSKKLNHRESCLLFHNNLREWFLLSPSPKNKGSESDQEKLKNLWGNFWKILRAYPQNKRVKVIEEKSTLLSHPSKVRTDWLQVDSLMSKVVSSTKKALSTTVRMPRWAKKGRLQKNTKQDYTLTTTPRKFTWILLSSMTLCYRRTNPQ